MIIALLAVGCGDADDTDASTAATTAAPAEAPSTTTEADADDTNDGTIGEAEDPEAATRTVTDAFGTVEVPAEPQRVVSVSVTVTGALLALDAPVVATAVSVGPLSDDLGFWLQWADVAVEAEIDALPGPELSIEAVAAAEPDLIVGTAFGRDGVDDNLYGLLEEIAPVVVIDQSGLSWQESMQAFAAALGRTDEAAAVEADFAAAVDAASLDTSFPVVAFVPSEDGQLNTFTTVSAHGRLLADLGLDVVDVEAFAGDAALDAAGQRADVVAVSTELVPDAYADATLLGIFADEERLTTVIGSQPTLGALSAVAEGRVVPLGVESFRIDPFSARLVLDRLVEAIGAG